MLTRAYRWFDRIILELGREFRLSYLPPLMVYVAYGVSGLTAIVGTFFVKEYLGLSAEFLAALGFWAGIPWALKMPLGHLVDLIWRHKAGMVYLGASLIAASLLIMVDREGNLGEPDEAKRKQVVENHHKWVDAAKYLGCHSVRVNAGGPGTREELAPNVVDGLGRLSEYAAFFSVNANLFVRTMALMFTLAFVTAQGARLGPVVAEHPERVGDHHVHLVRLDAGPAQGQPHRAGVLARVTGAVGGGGARRRQPDAPRRVSRPPAAGPVVKNA